MAVEQIVKMLRYEIGDRVLTPEGAGVIIEGEGEIPDNFTHDGSEDVLEMKGNGLK